MRPSELQTLLASAIPARLPILITGAPGIGKSDIVANAAAAAGADLILSHPVVSDPTDAKGLPWIAADKKSATFLPFGEMQHAINAKTSTVWFLDDLGQASPAVQASFMQLILARRVNGHQLPDCVTFVAATNRRTDRAGVQGILEPVKSRFASIVELEPSLDDWCNWAIAKQLPIEVISFLRFRPDLLQAFNPSADLVNSPSPRTWHNAAKLLALGLDATIEFSALKGAIGEGAAAEFTAFLQIFKELPSLDGILLDPVNANIPKKPASLFAVATGLANKANDSNFGRIATYAERLTKANHGEFAVLMLRDCVRRNPALMQTSDFIKLGSSETGKLFSGK